MVVTGRNETALQKLVAACNTEFGNHKVHYRVAETTNEEQVRALVDFTIAKFGRLDILILAAGIAAHSTFEDIENLEILRQVMETNYMGAVTLSKYALSELRKSKGQIVVIGSLSGRMGFPLRSAYCASKAAVHLFFKSLAVEESEIRVCIMMLDSFSGTNFRNNSLIKGNILKEHR